MRWSLFTEIVVMSWDTLRGNKMRSALTVLGIVIGITSIVGITSLVRGLDESFRDLIRQIGPDTIYVQKISFTNFGSGADFDELMKRPNVTPAGVMYTVADGDAPEAIRLLREMGFEPRVQSRCAKVAVIGGGMNGEPGVMAKIVEALTASNISIMQSADSNATIWVLVAEEDMVPALRALHTTFGLHLAPS